VNGRLLALLPWLLVFPLSAPAAECVRGALVGKVTYVRDGDTIELGSMAIRLSGLARRSGMSSCATGYLATRCAHPWHRPQPPFAEHAHPLKIEPSGLGEYRVTIRNECTRQEQPLVLRWHPEHRPIDNSGRLEPGAWAWRVR